MYAQIIMFYEAHPPLLDSTTAYEFGDLHARQETGLHLGLCAVIEALARGDLLSNEAEARLIVGTYLNHMNLTRGYGFRPPKTETQLLTLTHAVAAEIRIAHLEQLGRNPLTVDNDMALLVAIQDADLHSLIDHQDATGQLLVVRERIYGQPEVR